MFKKSLVAAAVIMFAGVAHAATDEGVAGGTITFNGSVTDTTCNVTTNNGSDFTVSLDPITLDSLGTTAGVVANGAKQFTMAVSGCTGSSTADDTLKITFSSSNVSDDQKYLTNYSGDAEGVGIALTTDGSAGTAVAFDSALDTGVTSTDAASTTGANVSFFANYYNYGGASVSTGSVVTTATYTFTYE
ncbi:type 1 fimbrial protein [Jejubacter calystegiae]|uniref:Type 1 fimbrial protein n=1 Tax=Jejubacter calystegiae TaxID=2579935 RepID=A0A4P8YEW2_9ENTR|nr:type 1 fimbrial protein [Jejubacter calystegiae]